MDSECGYDVPVVSEIESRFQCPICLLVLREPVQTACGHRFCDACIKRTIVTNNVLTCPVDKQYSRVNQMFPDVAIRREILSLAVKCHNVVDGCPWQGELRDLETHRERCQMETVTCPQGCGKEAMRCEMDSHFGECPSRQVKCDHCGAMVVYSSLQSHVDTCPKAKVKCQLCDSAEMARDEIAQHIDPDMGTCTSAIICCPFSPVGCRFKAERFRVDKHAAEAMSEHLALVGDKLRHHNTSIHDLKTELNEYKNKVQELTESNREHQRRYSQISKDLVDRNVTGKLHWKIKIGSHRRNRPNSFVSPEMYTGCPGYKVRFMLELNSHVERSTVHSGLFMELLKGEYDSQLIFPFNATAFVTLYDQRNPVSQRQNVSNTLVVREVPQVSRYRSAGNSVYRRGNTNFMRRSELVGSLSRFMRNDYVHMEITVVHCFYPPPEMALSPPSPSMTPQRQPEQQAVIAAAAAAAAPILTINSMTLNNP